MNWNDKMIWGKTTWKFVSLSHSCFVNDQQVSDEADYITDTFLYGCQCEMIILWRDDFMKVKTVRDHIRLKQNWSVWWRRRRRLSCCWGKSWVLTSHLRQVIHESRRLGLLTRWGRWLRGRNGAGAWSWRRRWDHAIDRLHHVHSLMSSPFGSSVRKPYLFQTINITDFKKKMQSLRKLHIIETLNLT